MTWVGGTWWELKISSGWRAEEHSECLTLTKSDDAAFQLSAATKPAGIVSLAEVESHCRSAVPASAEFGPVSFGTFTGFCSHYVDEDIDWYKFWLLYGNLLVLATWNGLASAWTDEKQEIDGMLRSLRIRKIEASIPQ